MFSTNPKQLCRCAALLLLSLVLGSCATSGTFQAYDGSRLPEEEVAVLIGQQYLRQDWLNRYVDAVRFARVDETVIEDSANFDRVAVPPGEREVTVYFYWDLGSQRGLAPALVQFASSRQALSRELHLDARAGQRYTVRAYPVFKGGGRRDITNLDYVDFWIEDDRGNVIVSREEGRYEPPVH